MCPMKRNGIQTWLLSPPPAFLLFLLVGAHDCHLVIPKVWDIPDLQTGSPFYILTAQLPHLPLQVIWDDLLIQS